MSVGSVSNYSGSPSNLVATELVAVTEGLQSNTQKAAAKVFEEIPKNAKADKLKLKQAKRPLTTALEDTTPKYLKAYYESRPIDELRQRIKDSDSKINLIEAEIKSAALLAPLTSFKKPDPYENSEMLNKLYESLHPKTLEFLKSLSEIADENPKFKPRMQPQLATLAQNHTAAVSTPQNRINRIVGHLSTNVQSTSSSIAVSGTAATASSPAAAANSSVVLPPHFRNLLVRPEVRLKLWEDSELRKGQDAIAQVIKEKNMGTVDSTKGIIIRERFILSIDGGGIRGKIPACVMDQIEKRFKQKTNQNIQLHKLFDLMTGTSTGAILACGASVPGSKRNAPFSAAELVKIYDDYGAKIFSRSWSRYAVGITVGAISGLALSQFSRFHGFPYSKQIGTGVGAIGGGILEYNDLGHLAVTKYSRDGLDEVVTKFFGKRTIGERVTHINKDAESPIELLIPTCRASDRKPLIFDSPIESGWTKFTVTGGTQFKAKFTFNNQTQFSSSEENDISIHDVLLSTTAAPSYFPPYEFISEKFGNQKVVDGGVCFNNPALLGYSKARTFWRGEKVHLLSLGTGYSPGQFGSGGKALIAGDLIDAMFQAQSYATSKFLDTLTSEIDASHKLSDAAKKLVEHAITLQTPNQKLADAIKAVAEISMQPLLSDLMVSIPYKPLESYTRVDGSLQPNPEKDPKIDLDGVHLLNEGNDPFTRAADRFIKSANFEVEVKKKGRLTLEQFIEKMRDYHGFM